MFVLSRVTSVLVTKWLKSLKDNTAYRKEMKNEIDIAVEMFNDGDCDRALRLLISLAKQIDCKKFHEYRTFEIRDVDAREQYNRICWYIAKIYDIKKDYSHVQFWANNLAFVPDISVQRWESILNSTDYNELREYFGDCNYDNNFSADFWAEWWQRPTL